jgi:hypothetical protein
LGIEGLGRQPVTFGTRSIAMSKSKEQLYQERELAQGEAYREPTSPSKVKNRNQKLRSAKQRLEFFRAKIARWEQVRAEEKRNGRKDFSSIDSIISMYRADIKELEAEINKLQGGNQ